MSDSVAARSVRFGALVCLVGSLTLGAVEQEPPMDEIERAIRESEYDVTWQDQTVLPDLDAAWHAVNRAQNLRFYFTEEGLRVVDPGGAGDTEMVRMTVGGVSPDGAAKIDLDTETDALTRRHAGMTERFRNSPGGLEHLLTIHEGHHIGERLEIEIRSSSAGIDVSSHGVVFRTVNGRRLFYSIMVAHDASGFPVEVDLSFRDGRIVLGVDDFRGGLPITIKSLLTGTANTVLEGNLTDFFLGLDVVTASGDFNGDGYSDVAAFSSGWTNTLGGEGVVLVFHGGPNGIANNGSGSVFDFADSVIEADLGSYSWPLEIAAIGDVNGDGFDDLATGESVWDPGFPIGSSRLRGGVWIFHGSSNGITATKATQADGHVVSNVDGSSFGFAVRGAGDVNGDGFGDVAVCAREWSDSVSQSNEGAVFVFHGSAGGLTATAASSADSVLEGNDAGLIAGQNLNGIGDVNGDGYDDLAIGLLLESPDVSEHAVAVVHGSSTGLGSNPTQPLSTWANALIQGNEPRAGLGSSIAEAVDVNGDGFSDLVFSGAMWSDEPGFTGEGAVLIFHGGPSGIDSNPTLPAVLVADTVIEGNPSPSFYSMQFGIHVGGLGDVNGDGYGDIVATSYSFSNPQNNEGGSFVFFGGVGGIGSSRTVPVQDHADLVIEGNVVDLYLGGERPGAGDVNGDGFADLVLGIPRYTNGNSQEGAVFIYHGGAHVLTQEADAHHDFPVLGASFGSPVRNAGDLNGDGFSDFVVGAPLHDVVSSWEGSAHVFYGSPLPSLSSPDWSFNGQYSQGLTGVGVASAGDLNGDGFGDLAVGTPYASNPEIDEGRVDVFYGSATGLSSSPDWFYEGNVENAGVGRAVSAAGDINGDGYGDLIVGAPDFSNGQSFEGRASVFFGSSMGLPSNPGWTFESNVASAALGFAVASAGDVNGDGFGDVIIGAYGYTSGESDEGAAFGFYGSENGLPDIPNWFIQTNRVDAFYGLSVAGVGDVNGDGFSDVVVGAPYDTNGEIEEGRAYVYHGSTSGLSTIADQVLEENIADAGFGVDVAAAGDVNGDGLFDVMVGSPNVGVPGSFDGRAYLYLGTAVGVGSDPGWLIEATGPNDLLGHSAAGAGDVNGDGFSDVVIGAPGTDAGAADGGSIEFFFGNAGAGRPVLARQYRGGDDPHPVQQWGLSHSGDSFQVSMTATSPRGRELVKMHVEACPPGEVWGDMDCRHAVSAGWTPIPLGEDGVVLTEAVSGLTEDVLYHWRAHVLYLPLHADEPGIAEPPVPRHGPWRTLSARPAVADIRVGQPQLITIELVGASSAVDEGAPRAEIEVVMTTSDDEASAVDSSIDFDTFDVTAVAGEDYVHTSFNRFFPAGTASGTVQTIEVDLINDNLDEPEEDFVVELYGPVGAVLGAQNTHTVTIADDDPPPELSALNVEVDEGAGSATVTLGLSAPTSFEVTVDFVTVDGSATAPMDYVSVSGTVMIPPMDIVTTVEIPIENDWIEEAPEFFTLELTNPVNVDLVTSEVTVTIIDDDAGFLFADGFESGDTGRWTGVTP